MSLEIHPNNNELNSITESGILSSMFSSRAVAQILEFLLDHKEFDYSPAEIAEKTGLSLRTVFREIPNLEKSQLIYHRRKIGKTSMYRLNADFQATLLLEKFVLQLAQVMRGTRAETTGDENITNDEKKEITGPFTTS
jgi:transcriptional antiterminator